MKLTRSTNRCACGRPKDDRAKRCYYCCYGREIGEPNPKEICPKCKGPKKTLSELCRKCRHAPSPSGLTPRMEQAVRLYCKGVPIKGIGALLNPPCREKYTQIIMREACVRLRLTYPELVRWAVGHGLAEPIMDPPQPDRVLLAVDGGRAGNLHHPARVL